ncbi:MAG: AraC family transcriptional regulator [Pseudoalteromonas sp.]|nr:AraC family transcriptional regulator [Pseudoalteromonas sp.]
MNVAVLAFPNISPFHLAVPCMVFGEAARSAGIKEFNLAVCSESKAVMPSSSGFDIQARHSISKFDQSDIIIIPSWPFPETIPSKELTTSLLTAHKRGAIIVGLCLGAYALAHIGLLDNIEATTHWAYSNDFKARFPKVKLNNQVLYLKHNQLYTSAGTAAAIDCCLHLVRQYLGSKHSNAIARVMVTAPYRTGGQSQFVALPVPNNVADERLASLLEQIQKNLCATHTIDELAKQMHMSRRTFPRHFQSLTGQSLGQWLLNQRLNYAQQLLEATDLSLEHLSEKCGFGSAVTLRHHFRKQFGLSPRDWRNAFRQA